MGVKLPQAKNDQRLGTRSLPSAFRGSLALPGPPSQIQATKTVGQYISVVEMSVCFIMAALAN